LQSDTPIKDGIRIRIPDDDYWRNLINCQRACPVGTDARGYVRAIANGDFEDAYLIARGPNPLASICGRICGAPCEAACRRGSLDQPVSIRALKRFVTQQHGVESRKIDPLGLLQRVLEASGRDCSGDEELASLRKVLRALTDQKLEGPSVAIIGSGPAGLAAAHDLALVGLRPTIFESESVPGGMLAIGIPAYRLPRDLIEAEIELIQALGVRFECSMGVGQTVGLEEIRRTHDATVVAVGAKRSRSLNIPGAVGPGLLGGVEFLRDVALGRPTPLGSKVVVIGGGNVAYDISRSVVRQTGVDISRSALRQRNVRDVHMVSLESLEELPADDIEIIEGDQEGVRRLHRLGPEEILRDEDGAIQGVRFKRVNRVFDDQGRFAPEFDEKDTTTIAADTVIWGIGQQPDLSFIPPEGDLRLTERGLIESDPERLTTSAPDVFVAGDIAHGPRLLIDAVASGKRAARMVYEHLTKKRLNSDQVMLHLPILDYKREADYEKRSRTSIPTLSGQERFSSQTAVIEKGYDVDQACMEAGRCLDCGVNTIFDSEKCILCGGCADICPELCLRLVSVSSLSGDAELDRLLQERYGDRGYEEESAIIKDETSCIRCGLCAERCPVGAITMERMSFQGTWTEVGV
jgi:NADPH-dependent glutamate synthase beta subunit-like oxidoreductase/ferredoxin